MPFIYLYTDFNSFDVTYMYPLLAIIIVAYDVFYCMYMPCYTLTNVYGLFKETYLQSVICAVISVILSVVLGLFYWPLIMLGPVFFYLTTLVYRTAIAKKRIPWFRLSSFLRRMAVVVLAVVLSVTLSTWIYADGYTQSWGTWLIHAILCALSVFLVVGIYAFLFERSATKGLVRYVKQLIQKVLKKKKQPS